MLLSYLAALLSLCARQDGDIPRPSPTDRDGISLYIERLVRRDYVDAGETRQQRVIEQFRAHVFALMGKLAPDHLGRILERMDQGLRYTTLELRHSLTLDEGLTERMDDEARRKYTASVDEFVDLSSKFFEATLEMAASAKLQDQSNLEACKQQFDSLVEQTRALLLPYLGERVDVRTYAERRIREIHDSWKLFIGEPWDGFMVRPLEATECTRILDDVKKTLGSLRGIPDANDPASASDEEAYKEFVRAPAGQLVWTVVVKKLMISMKRTALPSGVLDGLIAMDKAVQAKKKSHMEMVATIRRNIERRPQPVGPAKEEPAKTDNHPVVPKDNLPPPEPVAKQAHATESSRGSPLGGVSILLLVLVIVGLLLVPRRRSS